MAMIIFGKQDKDCLIYQETCNQVIQISKTLIMLMSMGTTRTITA